jgi:phosphatidylglycerol:prolipoprotein diacylglycerol transferase
VIEFLNLQLSYALAVLLGAALIAVFRPVSHLDSSDRSRYYRLQAITLVGAVAGAKLVVLMGDGLWPMRPFPGWASLLLSGRSIVGALLFGFLTAEAFKPILRYTLPPNDRFAMGLPISIATGRIGCWLSGCCLGVEMHGPLAVRGIDGVPRFPAPLVEFAFHITAAICMVSLWRRKRMTGRLFSLFLVGYGIFRFVTEFWRVTPKAFVGLSAYQWFSISMVAAGSVALYLRRDRAYAGGTLLQTESV